MRSVKLLAILAAIASLSQAALAVVDCQCGQASNSVISAPAITVSVGDTVAVFGNYVGGGTCPTTVTSVADTASPPNTFTAVPGSPVAGGQFTCTVAYYGKITTAKSGDVVTITWSGVVNNGGTMVLQVSGADTSSPLDAGPAGTVAQSGSMTASSATYSTAVANEILISRVAEFGVGGTITAASGYTIPTNGDCNARTQGHVVLEYKIVSATQSGITTSFASSLNYQDANVDVITFKQASAAANSATPSRGGIF